MRYVLARFKENECEKTYRMFVTESLRLAPQGQYISKSLYDVLYPQEEMSAEEIVNNVFENAGLSFEG